jgi:sugar phosphate permease
MSASIALDPQAQEELRRSWRMKIFTSTWLAYFGLYFCRKAFYIVKGTMGDDLNLDASALGELGSAYLLCYSIGQFTSAGLGEKVGARVLLLVGILVSIFANVAFGFANNYWTLMAFMCVNGFAQATGWPSVVGTMGNWTKRSERGVLMGVWGTCYQVGGIGAKAWAAFWMARQGWRGSFFAASMVVVFVWLVVFLWQRNKPEDVGLPLMDAEGEEGVEGGEGAKEASPWTRELVVNIGLVGCFYFGVKFVRYALWSWTPYFLEKNFNLAGDDAGYLSTVFDIAGFAGVIFAGVISDKLFNGKRTPISLIMLVGMTLACGCMYLFGSTSVGFFAITLGMVGFMLFGPDSLLTGAGAIEIGSPRTALAAAGIINGIGSIGSVVQELLVPRVYESSNGDVAPVFALLFGASTLSVLALIVVFIRNKRGYSDL